jgi:mono/diheme cytochrome c family protein
MNRIFGMAVCILAVIAAGDLSAQDGGTSTRDGVFSKAQADRGRSVFVNVCANCHTRSQFNDGTWRRKWEGRTVYDVFESVRSTMPNDNPSGLSDQEYVEIIAYLLSQNGYPAGSQDASEATFRKAKVEPPAGDREEVTATLRVRQRRP